MCTYTPRAIRLTLEVDAILYYIWVLAPHDLGG
jgi:hypothetical protein